MTPYDKSKLIYLKHLFNDVEKIKKNYSQSYQDMFTLTMLNGKHKGTYLEIGAFDPIFINNTYLLESEFEWKGISIDVEPEFVGSFKTKRKNKFLLLDALSINYTELFEKNNFPKQIDYLSIDIEPKTQTLECLKKLPLDTYRFSVITYETDYYDNSEGREIAENVRQESRKLLQSYGYELIVGNIANTGPNDVFEDWYVDPKIINEKIINKFKFSNDFNDSAEKFILKKEGLFVCNELYLGQGLGNQLWNYVTTRIIAKNRKSSFSIIGKSKFKGKDFMDIDFGENLKGGISLEGGPVYKLPNGIRNYYREKRENLLGTTTDISRTDNDIFTIPLNTKIDGNFQSVKYLEGHKDDILKWIRIKDEYKKYYPGENACVIHLRCGDFVGMKDVFLPVDYYKKAMEHIRNLDKNVKFYCVTDQKEKAKEILQDVEIIGSALLNKEDKSKASHHKGGPLGIDFCLLLNAKYLIIPNSSFSWWAAYLNTTKKLIIAPKYWARYNTSDGFWSTSDIITDDFTYLDKYGNLFSPQECWTEKIKFESFHDQSFVKISDNNAIIDLKTFIFLYIKDFIKYTQNIIKSKIKSKILKFKKKDLNHNNLLKKIREYKKNIKIYDIFTYNGEEDLLEIRLNILDKMVDEFIIVEAPTTFSGKPKPLYFELHKKRFSSFMHKIKYFVINDYPNDKNILEMADKSPNVPKNGPEHWRREFYQKESIKKALIHLKDEDICFIGDVDEIWNPEVLIDYTKDDIFKLKQEVYVYYLNNKSNEPWAGTMVTKYKNIKNNCLNHLRTKSKTKYVYLQNGGWHFTSMGGLEEVRRKLNDSYTQESYNTKDVQENLKNRFGKKDYIGRNFKFWINESDLPKYIIENKEKYKKLFK